MKLTHAQKQDLRTLAKPGRSGMRRPKPIDPVKPEKSGNLLGEVPLDVKYAGCSHLDCLPKCSLAKGHCERLEQAFIAAGYQP